MTDERPPLPYRQGVGLCLFNREGLVLCAERRDRPGAWQMPQGGVHRDEPLHLAALRELKEEVGTDKAEIIARLAEPLRYEFPDWLQHKGGVYRGKYRGQEQAWFALKFLGADTDISLDGEHEPEDPEFTAWKWVPLPELERLIVDFKRPVYVRVIQEFAPLGEKIKRGDPLPEWRP
ncbi:MAG: RNA pyrophosphohydrolase [Bdellovibrionales bacterium]